MFVFSGFGRATSVRPAFVRYTSYTREKARSGQNVATLNTRCVDLMSCRSIFADQQGRLKYWLGKVLPVSVGLRG